MSRFETVLGWVLQHEGGYVNHPQDPGGATNRGITQKTYDGYRAKIGKLKRSVREITREEVERIYREQYADPIWFDRLPEGLDYALFDFAVNSGVSRAVKTLQKIVGAKQDGVMGNNTYAAAVAYPNAADDLCKARLNFMRGLKTWKTFGRGWNKRINDVIARNSKIGFAAPVTKEGAEKAEGSQSLPASIASSRRSKAAAAGIAGVALSAVPEAVELARPAKEAFAVGDFAALIGAIITASALAYIIYVRANKSG